MTELEVFQRSLEISRITLGVSVVISTISIVFGILGMAFQRSHNRKSVKPLCNVDIRETVKGFRVAIVNAGLGPMTVTRVRLGKEGGTGKGSLIEPADVVPAGPHCRVFSEEIVGRVLPPMAEQTILECDGASAMKIRRALRDYTLIVSYSDIYDHTHTKTEAMGRPTGVRPSEDAP